MITKTDLFRLWAIAFRETLWKKYLPELVATLFLVFLVSYGVISYKLGFLLILTHRLIQILVDCTEKALRILATFMNALEKTVEKDIKNGN